MCLHRKKSAMKALTVRILAMITLVAAVSACSPNSGTNVAFRNYEYAPDTAFNNYPVTDYSGYGYNLDTPPRGLFQMNNNH